MSERKFWSKEEVEIFQSNKNLTVSELSVLLNRATSSICAKAKRLGITLATSRTKEFIICKKCGSSKYRKPSGGWFCKSCVSLFQKNKRKQMTESGQTLQRELWVKQRYNLTTAEGDRILKDQDDKCSICKQTFDKIPRIDHCHATGKVRGLLCHYCNIAIGLLKDNPELCRSAAIYLEEHSKRKVRIDTRD